MYHNKSVTAVILAAGSSRRMGLNINKVYISTNNGAIVQYSLRTFDSHPYVDDIIIVVRPEDKKLLQNIVTRQSPAKPVRIVFGGDTRCDSVYNAIADLQSDIAIIHDGARPLMKKSYITDCVESMADCCGAVIAIKAQETISVKNEANFTQEIPRQETVYMAQTPQCFHTKILRECHESITDKSNITDDSSLLELSGYRVKILQGDKSNIKITTPQDLTMAIAYLDMRNAPVQYHKLPSLPILDGIAFKRPKRA